jgi:hypothetical protein
VNWPEELSHDFYNPAPGIDGTIAIRVDKLLTSVWKCVAIKKTMETETRGKYMLIFKEEDMEKAKEFAFHGELETRTVVVQTIDTRAPVSIEYELFSSRLVFMQNS